MFRKRQLDIPEVVIERLPRYYRYFRAQFGKKEKVSSRELAEYLSTTASQVRHDLSYFGGFGLQGYGYNVEKLYTRIGEILGVDQEQAYVIVGAGGLGGALARYPIFQEIGFRLAAIFDVKPELVGAPLGDVTIRDAATLGDWLAANPVGIAVITTPAAAASGVAEALARGGVRAILNFAPVDLAPVGGVPVTNIHLTDKLLALSYRVKHGRPVRTREEKQRVVRERKARQKRATKREEGQ